MAGCSCEKNKQKNPACSALKWFQKQQPLIAKCEIHIKIQENLSSTADMVNALINRPTHYFNSFMPGGKV